MTRLELEALADECAARGTDVWKVMPPDNGLRRRIVQASESLKKAAKALRAVAAETPA